jgi:hypothetical protein
MQQSPQPCPHAVAVGARFSEHAQLAEQLARASCASSLRQLSIRKATRVSFADARFERLERVVRAEFERLKAKHPSFHVGRCIAHKTSDARSREA